MKRFSSDNLGNGEYASDLSGNSTEIAQKIFAPVGGDPEKDMVSVVINDSGSAGSMPGMPMPPEPTPVTEEETPKAKEK